MNIHEFQAKQILGHVGIPAPSFFVVSTIEDLQAGLRDRNWDSVILKIQIHAGGRGKAGGVLFVEGKENIATAAGVLLGKTFYNEQTGEKGLTAHQLLVSLPVAIRKEYYLGVTIDRQKGCMSLLLSPFGGMEVENIESSKRLILPLPMDGLRPYHFLRIAKFMEWKGELAEKGKKIISSLIQVFKDTDATLIEINPLAETEVGELLALDAKISLDDNALYRHPDLRKMFDSTQVNPLEAKAQEIDLAYISLHGSIGCMVNGAGLAMATMDLIQFFGESPANFLDVGGSATQEKVKEGFKMILSDPKVRVILVNIFGGIMNCETIASAIVEAVKELQLHLPLVVRLEGTNVGPAKKILKESGLDIIQASNLNEAAKLAVDYVHSSR